MCICEFTERFWKVCGTLEGAQGLKASHCLSTTKHCCWVGPEAHSWQCLPPCTPGAILRGAHSFLQKSSGPPPLCVVHAWELQTLLGIRDFSMSAWCYSQIRLGFFLFVCLFVCFLFVCFPYKIANIKTVCLISWFKSSSLQEKKGLVCGVSELHLCQLKSHPQ